MRLFERGFLGLCPRFLLWAVVWQQSPWTDATTVGALHVNRPRVGYPQPAREDLTMPRSRCFSLLGISSNRKRMNKIHVQSQTLPVSQHVRSSMSAHSLYACCVENSNDRLYTKCKINLFDRMASRSSVTSNHNDKTINALVAIILPHEILPNSLSRWRELQQLH